MSYGRGATPWIMGYPRVSRCDGPCHFSCGASVRRLVRGRALGARYAACDCFPSSCVRYVRAAMGHGALVAVAALAVALPFAWSIIVRSRIFLDVRLALLLTTYQAAGSRAGLMYRLPRRGGTTWGGGQARHSDLCRSLRTAALRRAGV